MHYDECWYCMPCEKDCPTDAVTVNIPYLLSLKVNPMSEYDDPELQDIADKLASEDVEMRRVGVLALVDSAEPEARRSVDPSAQRSGPVGPSRGRQGGR